MELDFLNLEQVLELLGQLLADRGFHYEVVAIGGGSLVLLGLIERATKDLDLVALVHEDRLIAANPLPLNLRQASEEVGKALGLGQDWLNIGPASLLELGLPHGFKNRLHTIQYGGLILHLAGRFDQICFKLYATVDQGAESKHFVDLKSLNPSSEELEAARRWCVTHDVSREFARELEQALVAFGIGNGIA